MKGYIIERNTDLLSDQPYTLRYENGAGERSGVIASVRTINGQEYSFVPSQNKPWYILEDGLGDRLFLREGKTEGLMTVKVGEVIKTDALVSAKLKDGTTIQTGYHDLAAEFAGKDSKKGPTTVEDIFSVKPDTELSKPFRSRRYDHNN